MMALASRFGGALMRANEIAEDQAISLKYLENILSSLKSAGLVISERGKKGGYALSRSPAEISLYDVLSPLEDSLGFVHCTEADRGCDRLEVCATREVWRSLKEATDRILKGTSLQDLLQRHAELKARAAEEALLVDQEAD